MLFPPLKKKWIFNLNLKFISNFKDSFYQITQDCIGYLFSSIILILIFNFFLFSYMEENKIIPHFPICLKETRKENLHGPLF